MKFKVEGNFEIGNEDLLDLVNNYQEDFELEVFEDFNEIPVELILFVLDFYDEITYSIQDLDYNEFIVTVIDEEN